MLAKRIIPCLDIQNGKVSKGTKFQNVKELGCPVALSQKYEQEGADELVLYDIHASYEERSNFLEIVTAVARSIHIPFTVGGGIRTVEDVYQALLSGADKVSINTAALLHPEIISESAKRFGNQCVVVSIDTKSEAGEYAVYTHGGRNRTEYYVLEWAKHCAALGAGELVINAIDQDGVKHGYDEKLLKSIMAVVNIPIVASGGAGCTEDFVALFKGNAADAALAASVFHYETISLRLLKEKLAQEGIPIRRINRNVS